jgi:hypothetical protein
VAIAFDADLGATDSPAAGSVTLTTTAAAASVARVVVIISYFRSVNTGLSGVTIGGTAAALDKRAPNGSDYLEIWSAHIAAGLASSSSIVCNMNGSANLGGILVAAASFTGIDTSGTPVDTTTSSNSTGTGWSSGAATNTAADALFFGGSGNEAVATTVPWTAVNGTKIHDRWRSADQQGFASGYTIAASVASRSISGTFASTSTANTGALVIYKASGAASSAGGPSPRTFNAIPFFVGGGL